MVKMDKSELHQVLCFMFLEESYQTLHRCLLQPVVKSVTRTSFLSKHENSGENIVITNIKILSNVVMALMVIQSRSYFIASFYLLENHYPNFHLNNGWIWLVQGHLPPLHLDIYWK